MYRVTIYTAWNGDTQQKQVEREIIYRWHWLAWLRSQFASCVGTDIRIARWCEITALRQA